MSLKDKTVLVVDDMRMVRMRLRIILNDLQVGNIKEAEDGNKALQSLISSKIDLVLSDWNMPNMTGIELLQAMRANDQLKTVPVIFITSESQKSHVVQSLMSGVSHYIIKPFTDDQVKEKILAVFKGKA